MSARIPLDQTLRAIESLYQETVQNTPISLLFQGMLYQGAEYIKGLKINKEHLSLARIRIFTRIMMFASIGSRIIPCSIHNYC